MHGLLLSPYHGGSHKSWANGYARHSQYRFGLISLPARFWKWRMHGGAVTLARDFLAGNTRFMPGFEEKKNGPFLPDFILATDMVDLSTFLSLTRRQLGHASAVLYMHENQLTYPLPPVGSDGPMRRQMGERDLHYAFINYASMLAADRVIFNSKYHLLSFFDALPKYLNSFPEFKELETVSLLKKKSGVLPVGIDLKRLEKWKPNNEKIAAPLIIWNQRWEYDKNPGLFFAALYDIASEGIPFRLAICGQNFRQQPVEFDEALERLSEQIVYQGYAPDEEYAHLLWDAAVTISTATHEFFGISMIEAIYCQTFPILPHRLSYPEIIPESFHDNCLYNSKETLVSRIRWALENPDRAKVTAVELAKIIAQFDWRIMAPHYDRFIGSLSSTKSEPNPNKK